MDLLSERGSLESSESKSVVLCLGNCPRLNFSFRTATPIYSFIPEVSGLPFI